ncbi:MAG: PEP-CTERM sorting domain-containing protein [Nitrospirae bacterium]|nr:PEP-CTERM sorting domain-containing protein [Nitrospirota bacterium]
MNKALKISLMVVLFGVFISSSAFATLVNLGPGSFSPLATEITFSEQAYGTVNPVYNYTGLTGLGNVTVAFGGYFDGQAQGGGFPVTLTDPTPNSPLTLSANNDSITFIQNDGSNPSSPVLSGTPIFNGPISVWFSVPVAGVGLDGGYFDNMNSTTIEAYDAMGNSLGTITNSQIGIEFFGLADITGANVIKGISFYITGPEDAGFAIDNLTFGAASVIVDPGVNHNVPEPSAMLLFASGMLGLAAFRKKFNK